MKKIEKDYKYFRKVIRGEAGEHLKKLVGKGQLFKKRGKNFIPITIPKIHTPRFIHGEQDQGVGRGPGEKDDVLKPGKEGDGKGDQAGEGHVEGMEIHVDMDWVLHFLKDELKLPRMKPKETETWEEIKYKYNNISRIGPRSLRHMRKTLKQSIKRNMASGNNEEIIVPGISVPIKAIDFINDDFRYRQYNEVKIPSSNAVIFFARDCSGSMNDEKCDIVSDLAWWIDVWIRSFYEKTERVYICHDTEAMEVDEEKFYKYRQGGGTYCSSAFDMISKQLKDRFPPNKWNVYVFYFTDGDNWGDDNKKLSRILTDKMTPDKINFVGMCQVLSYGANGTVKDTFDKLVDSKVFPKDFMRTSSIGQGGTRLDDEARGEQTKEAIKKLLGAEKVDKGVSI
jgi:uncharacterized sporulation protein YeaH/YhbH (DUF444 family)